jgi:hypothetical protein
MQAFDKITNTTSSDRDRRRSATAQNEALGATADSRRVD